MLRETQQPAKEEIMVPRTVRHLTYRDEEVEDE